MFDVVCSNCGKNCQVPFRPTSDKPVYCSECFEKMGGRSDSRRSQSTSTDQNKAQFDALNAKLDKILSLLEPKISEAPAPKAKKVAKKPTSTKKE